MGAKALNGSCMTHCQGKLGWLMWGLSVNEETVDSYITKNLHKVTCNQTRVSCEEFKVYRNVHLLASSERRYWVLLAAS